MGFDLDERIGERLLIDGEVELDERRGPTIDASRAGMLTPGSEVDEGRLGNVPKILG
jgi:hypothetical protein